MTENEIVLDASDQVLGRFCSQVAKRLMDGERVTVINAERAIVTGKPEKVIGEYRNRKERGDPIHGPKYPALAEDILRRAVRGMVPHKKERGRQALKRLEVQRGNPGDLDGERVAKDSSEITHKYVTLEEISEALGKEAQN